MTVTIRNVRVRVCVDSYCIDNYDLAEVLNSGDAA